MKIKVQNPDLSGEERTYLSSDYSSGTTLTVGNNEGFTDSWYVVVGEPGQEKSETAQISSTSGNTSIVISSALKFDHAKSTPVYLSQWNQLCFERKASGGSYSEVSGSPFSIEWDDHDKKSTVVVTGGETTDYYRWRFKNAALGTYSTYSGELAGTGLARTQVGFLIQQVMRNSLAQEVDPETLLDYFNDFQELIKEEIPKAWWFKKAGDSLATAESTYLYSISDNWSDFESMDLMTYEYISGDTDITYPLTWSPEVEMRTFKSDANQGDDDNVKWWSLYPPDSDSAKGYIALHPTPDTDDCYLRPIYYFTLTSLDSFDDTIVIPKPKGYVDYALYRICDDIKNDSSNANKFNIRVSRDIVALKKRSRRQIGQQELMRFRGQRGWSRLFGEQTRLSSSEAVESYWSP